MKNKNQTYQKTRKDLTDAFLRLYQEKGLARLTVSEVCQEAGYYRSTFYNHFTSLEDVLKNIEDSLLDAMQNESVSEHEQIISTFLKKFMDHADHLYFLFGPKGDPGFVAKYLETIKPYFEERWALKLRIKNPELDLFQEFIFAGCFAMVNRWHNAYKDIITAEQIQAMLQAMYYDGVFTFAFGKNENKK